MRDAEIRLTSLQQRLDMYIGEQGEGPRAKMSPKRAVRNGIGRVGIWKMADESENASHGRGIAGTMEVEQVEWEKYVE